MLSLLFSAALALVLPLSHSLSAVCPLGGRHGGSCSCLPCRRCPLQNSAAERASEPQRRVRRRRVYELRPPPSSPTPASPPPATAAAPSVVGMGGREGRDGRDHDHLFASHWRGYVTYLPAAQNELSRRGRNCWPFGQVSTDRRCGRSTSDASHCIHEMLVN